MAESGIYEIVNLVNGKRYVGSAFHLRLGGKQHKEISQLTGVSLLSVQRICRRERYQWVDPHIPPLTKRRAKGASE